MLNRLLPIVALLLGLAAVPAFAQPAAEPDSAAARTLEQNRKVSVGLPPATPAPPAAARAAAPAAERVAVAAR